MKITRNIQIEIEVTNNPEIPERLKEDFEEWLIAKAKESGQGFDYDDYCDDEDLNKWRVEFNVTFRSNQTITQRQTDSNKINNTWIKYI